MRLLLCASLSLVLGCGAMRSEENRPLLRRLDEALPRSESAFQNALIGVAAWPVAVPAGLVFDPQRRGLPPPPQDHNGPLDGYKVSV